MATKKKKASHKHAGRTQVGQMPTKNLTQDRPDDDEDSSTLDVKETGATVPTASKNKKKKKNLLLTLPLELRIRIYTDAMNVGTWDEESQSHVYEIGERRRQRSSNINSRVNNYTVENIGHNHFALHRTCRTIRNDILSCLNLTASFCFATPKALASFACGPLASPHFSTGDVDPEEHAFRVLCMRDFLTGNLRVMAGAEELRIIDTNRSRPPSVLRYLGRALLSVGEDCWLKEMERLRGLGREEV